MIVDKDNSPNILGDIYNSFERGLDPWHKDAFPEQFQKYIKSGKRREGWFCLDQYGNAINFIPDGAIIEEDEDNEDNEIH